jgi:hypothetical protein
LAAVMGMNTESSCTGTLQPAAEDQDAASLPLLRALKLPENDVCANCVFGANIADRLPLMK